MTGANPLRIIQGLIEVEGAVADFVRGDIGGDGPIVNHFRDQYRARCEEFSNAPGWLQGFVGLGAGGAISRICGPYLADNQWDPPELEPPFTGGQCPGVRYCISYTVTRFDNPDCDTTSTSSGNRGGDPCGAPGDVAIFGPISIFTEGSGTCGGPTSLRANFRNFQGNPQSLLIFGSGTGIVSWSASVTRVDGLPDDCGDPDPVPVPGPNPAPMPDPIRLPGEEPRPNPRDPDALPDIPVDPFPDPIGGPNFPALPDGFGFGGGASGGGGAGRPFDSIENDDETGGRDEEFDEPPAGEVWVGAYLELTKVPINITNVPGTGPENAAYFRIVGNFSLFFDSNEGRLYSDSITVKNQWTKFIGNPQGLPVSGARVSVLPGVRYRVIPVSAPEDSSRNGD